MHRLPSAEGGRSSRAALLFAFSLATLATATGAQTIRTIAGGWIGDGGPATSASLYFPQKIVVDNTGNLYVADRDNHRIRKISAGGTITTIAGTGTAEFGGDGGPAASARLSNPTGIALDTAGNLYIADMGNHRVRKVTPAGVITTVAGTGARGFAGDGGPATSARLALPGSVAVDAAGNLLIGDRANYRVRKVAPNGVISTFAGNGQPGTSGPEGGSATSAAIHVPSDLAADAGGGLYIVGGGEVRKVTAAGTISSFAGGTPGGFSGDGGPVREARFSDIFGVAVDSAGNVYLSDSANGRIRKVSAAGIVSTVAGNGSAGVAGDGGAATSAAINSPNGLAVDGSGNLFIADTGNARVRRVSAVGVIGTVAGTGSYGFNGDGKLATRAALGRPASMALDAAGNLYFADSHSMRVRKLAPDGRLSTVAGNGSGVHGGDGGAAIAAGLVTPTGVVLDSSGNLFIADSSAQRIRKVTPAGAISTVAGNGEVGWSGDGGPAANASLNFPSRVAVDRNGNLYISDSGNRIRKVNAAGVISTVAGMGAEGYNGDGGAATSAALWQPSGLAVDAAGNLYIADTLNSRVRKVTPAGTISTVAGNGEYGFSDDGGLATSAKVAYPSDVAFDGAGNLYIAEAGNARIRMVTPAGIISSVAGNGTPGIGGEGVLPTGATLDGPLGLTIDSAGSVYIADAANRRIRKLVSVAQPRTAIEYYNTVLRHYLSPLNLSSRRLSTAAERGRAGREPAKASMCSPPTARRRARARCAAFTVRLSRAPIRISLRSLKRNAIS